MTEHDILVLGQRLGTATRGVINAALSDLRKAIDDRLALVKDGTDGLPGATGEAGARGEPGPQGERGEKGDPGDKGDPGERGADGQPGADGRHGRDGIDGKSVTVDDIRGAIEVEIARALLDLERRSADVIQRAIDRIPAPVAGKDGEKGADGKDGVGFDDLEAVYDEFGRMSLRAVRGDVVKEWRIPGIVDRGVWRDGNDYLKGDGSTYGGSFWIAQKDTTLKPGADNSDWRLAVKRGQDGKKGEQGPKGGDGRDGVNGRDWGRG